MVVDAHYAIVCTGCQEFSTRREAYRMNRAGMIAHRRQLSGLIIFRVCHIVDRVCGPDPDIAIPCTCDEALTVGRDMAAVYLVLFLLAWVDEPCWLHYAHGYRL